MSNNSIDDALKNDVIYPALCSSELLENIINDICDYGLIMKGNFRLDISVGDLKQIINYCVNLFQY